MSNGCTHTPSKYTQDTSTDAISDALAQTYLNPDYFVILVIETSKNPNLPRVHAYVYKNMVFSSKSEATSAMYALKARMVTYALEADEGGQMWPELYLTYAQNCEAEPWVDGGHAHAFLAWAPTHLHSDRWETDICFMRLFHYRIATPGKTAAQVQLLPLAYNQNRHFIGAS